MNKLTVLAICLSLALTTCGSSNSVRTGHQHGKLLPCPNAPKCVSSQSEDTRHRMEPIPYTGSLQEVRETLIGILQGMERAEIVEAESRYLYVQFKSAFFGFVDDVEFYLDDQEKVIHFRSSARFGYYDWKVNRKRMEYIRTVYEEEAGTCVRTLNGPSGRSS